MAWSTLQPIWPILAVLVYVMVYSMMRVLSETLYHKIRIHNRICEARAIRRRYFEDE